LRIPLYYVRLHIRTTAPVHSGVQIVPIVYIAHSPFFPKDLYIFPIDDFRLIYYFLPPYFEHDAFMHHALHVGYWTPLSILTVQSPLLDYLE